MDLIASLGVNSTLLLQFAIFSLAYIALNSFVFKPYFRSVEQRRERTKDVVDISQQLAVEAEQLEQEYAVKARQMSLEFKAAYDEQKRRAVEESESILTRAKTEAREFLQKTRDEVAAQEALAEKSLSQEVPGVAQAIVEQMLGKAGKV